MAEVEQHLAVVKELEGKLGTAKNREEQLRLAGGDLEHALGEEREKVAFHTQMLELVGTELRDLKTRHEASEVARGYAADLVSLCADSAESETALARETEEAAAQLAREQRELEGARQREDALQKLGAEEARNVALSAFAKELEGGKAALEARSSAFPVKALILTVLALLAGFQIGVRGPELFVRSFGRQFYHFHYNKLTFGVRPINGTEAVLETRKWKESAEAGAARGLCCGTLERISGPFCR